MIIEKILEQLTPERVKKEIEEVRKVKLSPELQKWIREYEKVGDRNEFLWKWLCKSFQTVHLPIVSKRCQKYLWEDKVLVTIFITQLDDAADKKGNKALLKELLKIPLKESYIKFNHLNKKEKEYLFFTKKIWNHIKKRIKRYPKYKELEDVFNYDISQVLNALYYSYFVNKNPYLINKTEYWLYLPYNMVALVYSDFDLMSSSKFDLRKIGKVREIILCAQKMARIGNWVSTWEREIYENDFTSGVFAYAIDSNIINVEDLKKGNKLKVIEKIKNAKIEKELLKDWERYYYEIERIGKKINTIDIKKFLSALEKFIFFHLSSRRYK